MTGMIRLLVATVALALALAPAALADPGDQKYILALGDSETAGTQAIAPAQVLGGSPETEVNRSGEGYADQLAARLEAEGHKAKLVNLACYYETTTTMIDGGGLCTYPHGSQLEEAEQFLHAHGDKVRAIVMSIGANDMLRSCAFFDAACYELRLTSAATNLAAILSRLRAEGGDVPIAIVNYHNPFLALWFVDPFLAQLSVTGIVQPLARMIATASAPFGVVVADTLATFQTENFTDTMTLPGIGTVPVNVGLMCVYSWMCTHNDIHLNTACYALVAQAVEQALGL
jgi:lysophospholipase L1-like esterase